MGKFAVIALLVSALAAGGGIWYTQTQAFWAEDPEAVIELVTHAGDAEPIPVEGLNAIRSGSSPLGFRACFETPLSLATLSEGYVGLDEAEPTVPPPWFDCFVPEDIALAVDEGRALAFLGGKNIGFGVDRVVVVMDDGRGFAWHVLNNCGRKAYDGSVVGEACPDRASFQGAE